MGRTGGENRARRFRCDLPRERTEPDQHADMIDAARGERRCFLRAAHLIDLHDHLPLASCFRPCGDGGWYALWYNFVRIRKTLKVTPAMAAGSYRQTVGEISN